MSTILQRLDNLLQMICIRFHQRIQLQLNLNTMSQTTQEFSVADLTRALLRQYLSHKGLKATLACFEQEDKLNIKKISKSKLIELTSLKNLYQSNKQTDNNQITLLQILVSYLHNKYKIKSHTFNQTQPQTFSKTKEVIPQYPSLQQVKIQTVANPVPQKNIKQSVNRPSSSGNPAKKKQEKNNTVKQPQKQEKRDLKVIYKKLAQVQTDKNIQKNVQKQEKSHKQSKSIEQKKDADTRKSQTKQNNLLQISSPSQKAKNFLSVQQAKNSYSSNLQNAQQTLKQQNEEQKNKDFKQQIRPKVLQIEQDYEQAFEEDEQQINQKSKAIEYQQNLTVSVPKKQPEKMLEKAKVKVQEIKEPKKVEQVKVEDIYEQKQQNININNKVAQQKEVISNKDQRTSITPSIEQVQDSKIKQMDTKKEVQKPIIVEQQQLKIQNTAGKGRTKMRMLGSNRPVSAKKKQIQETAEIKIIQKPKQIEQRPSLNTIAQSKPQIEVFDEIKPQKKQISDGNTGTMRVIGKKKKAKEEASEINYPTKFKFDQNFTHQIQKEAVYQYQPYDFGQIILDEKAKELYPDVIFSSAINYKVKGGSVAPIKKKQQKTISSQDAQKLKKVVFQSSTPILPKSWAQGFILSPFENTPYGLKQIQGGPCGIIAAVQCYFLKHLLSCSQPNNTNNQITRQVCLVAAITNLLWKVKQSNKLVLVFAPKGASKVEVSNLRTVTIEAESFQVAFAGIWSVRDQYIGASNHGVATLMFSSVLTRGFDLIESQMDNKQNPLIGNHGHCTQELVNMFITGKATSNCFDGDKVIDDYSIKGIKQKSQFGFLTVFEVLKYIQIGKNMKNPIFPVWIICKEFHYHVVFAGHYLISESNKSSKMDIIYFDGLYNCEDRIRITLQNDQNTQNEVKIKDLPLIEQVLSTKWGRRKADWNGSIRIL